MCRHTGCKKFFSSNYGFTLAEVLLVITIIGIIAAMTIPTLINNVQSQSTVARLKKANSTLSQAFISIKDDDCGGTLAGCFSDRDDLFTHLATKMSFLKVCDNSELEDCFPTEKIYNLSGTVDISADISGGYSSGILSDGTSISFTQTSVACNHSYYNNISCGYIYVNLKGIKTPIFNGKDMFQFIVTKNGIVPDGLQDSEEEDWDTYCDSSSGARWNGDGCAARIITTGSTDY